MGRRCVPPDLSTASLRTSKFSVFAPFSAWILPGSALENPAGQHSHLRVGVRLELDIWTDYCTKTNAFVNVSVDDKNNLVLAD